MSRARPNPRAGRFPASARCARILGLIGVTLLSIAGRARAEGNTYNAGGTKALARGGAVAARPEDPFALHHNPAGLASLEGTQVYAGADMPFYRACVQPIGYYGWGVYQPGVSEFGDSGQVNYDAQGRPVPGQYATTPLHEVCDTAADQPIPQLAISHRLTKRLGVAFGFVGPSLIGNQHWGGSDGTIERDGRTWPTPTRYQLVEQRVTFALDPTIGVGYQLNRYIAIGANFSWVALAAENTVVETQVAGTSPHNDMLVTIRASDYFIPSSVLAVHGKPHQNVDLALTFLVRADFDGSGDAIFETNTYAVGAQTPGVPYKNPPIELERVHFALPWVLTAGARYGAPLGPDAAAQAPNPAPGMPRSDPMATERWDVELDTALVLNARTSETSATVVDTCQYDAQGNRIPTGSGNHSLGCQTLAAHRLDPSGQLITETIDVPQKGFQSYTLDRHLENQLIFRLGGSYTVLPRRAQVHGGIYYETRGVNPDYANIDNMLFRRVGVGTGGALRIGRWDLMLAYGHIFQETLEVGTPPHQPHQSATSDPRTGFDKRIGQPCAIGVQNCPYDRPLPEQNPPSNPDGTASLRQGSIINSPTSPPRVVNAGIYRANIDVVSIGAVYHF